MTLVHMHRLLHGVWEAKDTHDDLTIDAAKKFKAGYPKNNILFGNMIIWVCFI